MTPSTPADRNYGQETTDNLKAQIDLAPKQFAANAEFQPKYAALQTQVAQQSLLGDQGNNGLLALYQNQVQPQLSAASAAANTAQRASDIGDVSKFGAAAVSAIKGANPEQQALITRLNGQVSGQSEDPLLTMMRSQATDELGRGAYLDPSLAREVQQSVRAGQAARGMGYGTPDLRNEALYTGQAAEQLRQSRRAFASSVLGQSQQAQGQQFGQAAQVAQINAAGAVDPMLAILGRPSSSYNPSLVNQGYAGAQQAGQGLFNPESAYAGDIHNTNYNAKAASQIAGANNTAALAGAGLSAL